MSAFASNSTGVCTVSGLDGRDGGCGHLQHHRVQAGSDNYNAATDVTQTFGVAKADQSINFTDPTDATFVPAGTVSLTATASSGLDVSFCFQQHRCLHGVRQHRHDGRCGNLQHHRVAGGQR